MSLALGDALAVALLERKGFSAQDFRVLHPGEASNGLLCSDLMHEDDAVPLVKPISPCTTSSCVSKQIGCVGVIDHSGTCLV